MNENAKKWVEALRSGKYAQTHGSLRNTEDDGENPVGFCCLGVACDVSGLGRWFDVDYEVDSETADMTLPKAVQTWLGLREPDGSFGDSSLTAINDAGDSFEVIAGIIEKHADQLFE